MKAIMLMFDTLSRNFLPNYGNNWVKTPNFERLQSKCTTFNNFYGGSMPCMPARREIHTGKYNFLHRGWGPLESFDFSVFEKLQEKGIYTHLITDHSHYWEDGGATYHNRYSTWEGFRGQEGDRWLSRLTAEPNTNNHILNKKGPSVTQHYANRNAQTFEEELSSVQTINAGLKFLDNHHDKDNWFVQIECFDPHEPFLVPEKYRELYNCIDSKDIPYWPAYQQLDTSEYEKDIEDLRKEYAALISMCDFHLGKVLDFMDDYDMWKDTMLIINTDHGFLLGEHNYLGKNISPMYEEIVHTPFFMHVPNLKCDGKVCSALSQTIDIPATILDYFGIDTDIDMDGKSLIPVMKEPEFTNHESILFGVHGSHVNIFDGRYVYMRASENEDNAPLAGYTLMTTQMRGFYSDESLANIQLVEGNRFTNGMPCLRVPLKNPYNSYKLGNLLFDLKTDPDQNQPFEDEEIEDIMKNKLISVLKRIDTPDEEFIRLGLNL